MKLPAGTESFRIEFNSLKRPNFTQAIPITFNNNMGANACMYEVSTTPLSPFLKGFIHSFIRISPKSLTCHSFPHLAVIIAASNSGSIARR